MKCSMCDKDKEQMLADGSTVLYLDNKQRTVTNWPGTLKFDVPVMWIGKHNKARKATFVRFIGPDDKVWSGKQVGDNSQLCFCKRTKILVEDIAN